MMTNTNLLEPTFPPYALIFALALVLLVSVVVLFFRFKLSNLKLLTRNLIVENLRDGIIVLDGKNRITDINPAARDFFDIVDQPVVGKSPAEVFKSFPDLLDQLEGKSPSRVEISVKSAAERLQLEVTVAPVTHKFGMTLGRAALIRDMTGWAKLTEEVERLATTDTLTGLLNRKNFLQACEFEIKRSLRYERSLALLLLDVDFLKKVNDEHGYAVGDKVLKVIAASLRDRLRQHDVIGRYGGEEFAILLRDTEKSAALKTAERISLETSKIPIRADAATLNVTVSIGVAALEDVELKTFFNLLNAADAALCRAKENGRNCVEA